MKATFGGPTSHFASTSNLEQASYQTIVRNKRDGDRLIMEKAFMVDISTIIVHTSKIPVFRVSGDIPWSITDEEHEETEARDREKAEARFSEAVNEGWIGSNDINSSVEGIDLSRLVIEV